LLLQHQLQLLQLLTLPPQLLLQPLTLLLLPLPPLRLPLRPLPLLLRLLRLLHPLLRSNQSVGKEKPASAGFFSSGEKPGADPMGSDPGIQGVKKPAEAGFLL
jgi:hypothetical protein